MDNAPRLAHKRSRAALAVVASTVLTLGLVFSGAATAAPTETSAKKTVSFEPSPTQYGYLDVYDKTAYMKALQARDIGVLFIDEEHGDDRGFWYAKRSVGGARGFVWSYQPYGKWCLIPTMRVEWNGWLNNYSCMVDPAKVADDYPQWAPRSEQCKASTGYPWKRDAFLDDPVCSNNVLVMTYNPITQAPGSSDVCAPWEDQGLTPSGAPKCQQQTYPWVNRVPDSSEVYWTPEPDTCTGMPANSNFVLPAPDPDDHVPATGGDGTCTGEAHAPNCAGAPQAAQVTSRACTGIEPSAPQTYSATSAATETVEATVAVTESSTATAKAVRYKKTVRVTVKHKGRKFRGSGTARLVMSAKRSATQTRTFTAGGTFSATSTCTSQSSQAAAQACADDKARQAALEGAKAEAKRAALSEGRAVLRPQVARDAQAAAKRAVAATTVTAAQKRSIDKKARANAIKNARSKFRR